MDDIQSFTWFVGIFEGEGTFGIIKGKGKQLCISMTDLDVLERVQTIVGGSVYALTKRKEHWKDAWVWRLGGADAKALAQKMEPFLMARRADRCREFIRSFTTIEELRIAQKINRYGLKKRASQLRSEGLFHKDIASMLGIERSYVSKLLK